MTNLTPDDTYERLRRVPFMNVVDHAAESLINPDCTREEAREKVIRVWGSYVPGMVINEPKDSYWSDYYRRSGWTLKELFEEAVKEYAKMVVRN